MEGLARRCDASNPDRWQWAMNLLTHLDRMGAAALVAQLNTLDFLWTNARRQAAAEGLPLPGRISQRCSHDRQAARSC